MGRRPNKDHEKVFRQLEWVKKRLHEKVRIVGIKTVLEETGLPKAKISHINTLADKLTIREFLVLCAHLEENPSSIIPDKPKFIPSEIYDSQENKGNI